MVVVAEILNVHEKEFHIEVQVKCQSIIVVVDFLPHRGSGKASVKPEVGKQSLSKSGSGKQDIRCQSVNVMKEFSNNKLGYS